MSESVCKGCGAPITWAKNVKTGNMIPLDLRPTVYEVYAAGKGVTCAAVQPQGHYTALGISHFASCPMATQFSKGKKA